MNALVFLMHLNASKDMDATVNFDVVKETILNQFSEYIDECWSIIDRQDKKEDLQYKLVRLLEYFKESCNIEHIADKTIRIVQLDPFCTIRSCNK